MEEKNKSNKKLTIGIIISVVVIALLILGTVYSIKLNSEQEVIADVDSSSDKEYVKLSGDIEGLTDEQISSIENDVLPMASEFFKYEEANIYYDKRVGYVISFVVTNESFGETYSEYADPTSVSLQSDAIEIIHHDIEKASLQLDSIIDQSDGVTMEFYLPKMESQLIMKVRGGNVIFTVFEEE